jgi:hypothetical protein
MSELRTKQHLILLETFSQAILKADSADEIAEILLNTLFEAFPGFDEGYVFLPCGEGGLRSVVRRKGVDVSYPSKRGESLAVKVAEAERTGRVERLPDGCVVATEESVGGDQGIGITGISRFPTPSRRQSRLYIPLGGEAVTEGYLEFGADSRLGLVWHWRTAEMREFLDIAASALTNIG